MTTVRRRTYALTEVASRCGVHESAILNYIERQWVVPAVGPEGAAKAEGSFELDEEDLARVLLIRELQADLGVNDEAVPIILHLLDQLNRLQGEIYEIRHAISQTTFQTRGSDGNPG